MRDGQCYDLAMGLKKSVSVIAQTMGVGAGVFGVLEGVRLPATWADVPAVGIGTGVPVLLGIVKFLGNYRKQTGKFPWQR
jgi:hypothetical protein